MNPADNTPSSSTTPERGSCNPASAGSQIILGAKYNASSSSRLDALNPWTLEAADLGNSISDSMDGGVRLVAAVGDRVTVEMAVCRFRGVFHLANAQAQGRPPLGEDVP